MYYFCIENNTIISVCDYQPSVPANVRVVAISDVDHKKIADKTHVFDPVSGSLRPVQPTVQQTFQSIDTSLENYQFLHDTDWKVMRHIRQKALGIPTSLTDEQYLSLEQRRQDASAQISKPPTI